MLAGPINHGIMAFMARFDLQCPRQFAPKVSLMTAGLSAKQLLLWQQAACCCHVVLGRRIDTDGPLNHGRSEAACTQCPLPSLTPTPSCPITLHSAPMLQFAQFMAVWQSDTWSTQAAIAHAASADGGGKCACPCKQRR